MPYQIEEYKFGKLVVNGEKFHRDLILLPTRIVENWNRGKGHLLQSVDLMEVLASFQKGGGDSPEVLIIGCGSFGRMKVDGSAGEALFGAGLAFESHRSERAVNRFKELTAAGKRVALAIHLTC